ncbi:MAG: hypothetical protein WCP34_00565 [Pseudomonadota bacterium]
MSDAPAPASPPPDEGWPEWLASLERRVIQRWRVLARHSRGVDPRLLGLGGFLTGCTALLLVLMASGKNPGHRLEMPGNPDALETHLAMLTLRAEAMEKTVSELEQRLGQVELTTHRLMTPIPGRRETGGHDESGLGRLEAQVKRQRLALALIQMGMVCQTRKPYSQELETLNRLGAREPRLQSHLAAIAVYAQTGVATVAELRDSFGAILLSPLKAQVRSQESSWIERTSLWVNHAMSSDPASPPPTDAVFQVDEVIRKLSEDDLRGAIEQLQRFDGVAANLVSRWLREARARRILDEAYDVMTTMASDLVGQYP